MMSKDDVITGHRFNAGDRVKRISKENVLRHGVITNVYPSYRDHLGQYLILYSVAWNDNGQTEHGYMDIANGLIRDEEN